MIKVGFTNTLLENGAHSAKKCKGQDDVEQFYRTLMNADTR